MSNYEQKKNYWREQAMEFQRIFEIMNYDTLTLSFIHIWFYNAAKRYGLIKEFRENAII